jgi:hypothetical protein
MEHGIMTDIAKLLREAAYHLRGTDCPLSLPDALDVAAAELESAKPGAFTCHGNSDPAYSCNRLGDQIKKNYGGSK